MQNEELQSKVIDFLRFPLIVGVLFIHNYSPIITIKGQEIGKGADLYMYTFFSDLFSQVIGRISVPLFFFISGFLFFLNVNFNFNVFKKKLYSRCFTLLIPYLFWNLSFLLFYYIASHMPIISSWFKGAVFNWKYLWGGPVVNGMSYPIAYQFWFIRDLIIVVLITPLIYWFIKRTNIWGLILIAVVWFSGFNIPYIGVRGLSMTALFFFMGGAWFSINRMNLIEEFKKPGYWSYIAYVCVAAADIFTKDKDYNIFIHNVGILIGIICCFNLAGYLLNKGKIKTISFLSSASFFIFAIHDPWLLTQIKKVLFVVFKPETDIMLTIFYFIIVLLTIIISLAIYYGLKRLFPRFTAFISAGR